MTDFAIYKATILRLTKGSPINLQVAKDKAGLKGKISTVQDAEAVLKVLIKPRKVFIPIPLHVKQRYNEAHALWFKTNYPGAYDAGHYVEPVMPKIFTSNGLTTFTINLITWQGFRATRVSSSGRMAKGKWIPGPTRSGSSDISSTINGRSVMLEIKAGKDVPSDKQLAEQRRERSAGGVYEFVRSAEDVINILDSVIYG